MNRESVRRLFEERLSPEIPPDSAIIGSWESLGNQETWIHILRIQRLKAVFGQGRIIMTIRNPLTQVPSEYLQNVRGHAIRGNRPWMGPSLSIGIEEWFERNAKTKGGIRNTLSYTENIRASMDELGPENVGVFLFEHLRENPEDYYTSVCEFIGIDSAEAVRLTAGKHVNRRLREYHIEKLKDIDRSRWKRFMFKRKRPAACKRIMGLAKNDPEIDSPPARPRLPAEMAEKIVEVSREGHRWLVNHLGLPLEKYGYPL
jgi:hypothetical protein